MAGMSEIRLQDHDSLCSAAQRSVDGGIEAEDLGMPTVAAQLFTNAAIYTSAAGIVAAIDRLTDAIGRQSKSRNVF